MTDWLTIRVQLQGGRGTALQPPSGRVMLVHADHSFSDLAEAVDVAFARWDLSPLHEFDVEGRRLVLGGGDEPDDIEVEDSDEVTVGEVGLRTGARFAYLFDPVSRWTHDCLVSAVDVDPYELYGEEPDRPVPVDGWGTVPDQYGRLHEEDELPDVLEDEGYFGDEEEEEGLFSEEDETWDSDEEDEELATWDDAESGSWDVVDEALRGVERACPREQLTAAVAELRAKRDGDDWRHQVLWAAAGLADEEAPAAGEDAGEDLWVELAAGVVSPGETLPLDPERASAWAALEPADWAGAVIELVRAGEGQSATPASLLDLVVRCPEVDNEALSDEDQEVLLDGFATVVELWRALGVVDAEDKLTALGRWGLPEALQAAWEIQLM